MERVPFAAGLRPLSFAVLEPVRREPSGRLRFLVGNVAARAAKATDERNRPLDERLLWLCETVLSDMYVPENSRITRPPAAAFRPSVPFLRLKNHPSPHFAAQKTEELNKNFVSRYCNDLYILLQDIDTHKYAAGQLTGFESHDAGIYPRLRGMFGQVGVPPLRTKLAAPVLIQKVGPVRR